MIHNITGNTLLEGSSTLQNNFYKIKPQKQLLNKCSGLYFQEYLNQGVYKNGFGHGEGEAGKTMVEWSRVQSSSRYERQKEWILALEKTIQRKSARPVKFVVGKDKWPQRYFLQHHPEFLGKTLLSTSKVKRGNCSVGRFSRLVKGEVFSLRGSFHD